MTTTSMPKIDLAALRRNLPDAEDYAIALRCINPKTGCLRASKPEVKRAASVTGIAAYAWRMAAFAISPEPRHQCMPCTADFDLPGWTNWQASEAEKARGRATRKAATEQGDRIEAAIVHSVPVDQWHGVRRWGNAFGLIGTPRYNAEGAVIYR